MSIGTPTRTGGVGGSGGLTQSAADALYDAAGAAATAQANAVQRANHTGTQTMSTISDAGTLATASPDGSTVELSSTTLRVKDASITRAKLAAAIAQDCIQVQVTDLTTALTVGDGQQYFVVPSHLNGLKLKSVEMGLTVAQSTSGIPTFQIANVTQGWDMLTTKLTVDANEWHSSTAATAAVIDTASSHDVVTTGDRIRFDCDVAGTGTKGVFITMYFGS